MFQKYFWWAMVMQLIYPTKTICLILISNDKNCSKFNIFHTLCLKISKSFSLNPTCWRFPNKTKSTPKFFHNLFFWFKWIFNDKIVQFNNLSTIVQNITKPTWCIPTRQGAFEWYQECGQRCCSLGDFNVRTNKLPSFIDRFVCHEMWYCNVLIMDLSYKYGPLN